MKRILLLPALAIAAVPAAAQARYLPQPDTLYYESLNPYHMYVMRGRDTLMDPVISFQVERHVWRPAADGLRAAVHTDDVGGGAPPTHDVMRITPGGVVAAIDEGAADHRGRWDLVLHLPADGDLSPGRTWTDSLGSAGGDGTYQVRRELRVERIADTLGSRMAVVRGTGTVRYRDAYAYSDTGSARWWIDVSGAVRETFLFDVGNGRMASREWRMDLRGTAGLPAAGGGVDTLPAGLRSRITRRLVTAERARLLLRGLPPGDTTLSGSGAPGSVPFTHTVREAGDTVASGFTRVDGMLTTARAEYRDGRTVRYEVIGTEPLEEAVRRVVRVDGAGLRVESGGRDTVMPLPRMDWAVADYAMEEHLAPALARRFRNGKAVGQIAVYRPYPMKWDTVQVTLQPLKDDVLVATLRSGDGLDVMFLETDGTLLYHERVEPFETQRRPRPGTEQATRVEALVDEALRLFNP